MDLRHQLKVRKSWRATTLSLSKVRVLLQLAMRKSSKELAQLSFCIFSSSMIILLYHYLSRNIIVHVFSMWTLFSSSFYILDLIFFLYVTNRFIHNYFDFALMTQLTLLQIIDAFLNYINN